MTNFFKNLMLKIGGRSAASCGDGTSSDRRKSFTFVFREVRRYEGFVYADNRKAARRIAWEMFHDIDAAAYSGECESIDLEITEDA